MQEGVRQERQVSGQAASTSGQDEYDAGRLDFFSRSFDPLRALLTEGVLPPLPAARPEDKVYRCRHMLPPDHPDAWREPQRAAKSKARTA